MAIVIFGKQLYYEDVTPYQLLHRCTGDTIFRGRLGRVRPQEEVSHLQTLSSAHMMNSTTITLIFGPMNCLFAEDSLML